MCELDYFIYGMYGLFGALGSYLIYKKTKLKFQIDETPIESHGVKQESTGLAEKN
jgi:hypothetical protein